MTVEPSALAKMPVVNKLDLSAYPDNPLERRGHAGQSGDLLVVGTDRR